MRKLLYLGIGLAVALGTARPAAAADDMRALLDRAIKAHAGKAKGGTITALEMKTKGKIDLAGGIAFTQNLSVQMPNKFKEAMELNVMDQTVTTVTVFDGKNAWLTVNGKAFDLTDKQKAALKGAAYMIQVGRLTALKDRKKFELSPLGETTVNGKPAVGVRVSSKGHKDINLYFDKKTGLLAKMEHQTTDFQTGQEVNEERIITEYKDHEGRPEARKVVIKRDGKKLMDVEITEITYLDKFDDSEFAKPE